MQKHKLAAFRIEVNSETGLPQFSILPDTADLYR